MRITNSMRENDQKLIERKGKGIAAILTQGNYNEPSRQVRDLNLHHEGGCAVLGPNRQAVGLTSLVNQGKRSAAAPMHSQYTKTGQMLTVKTKALDVRQE